MLSELVKSLESDALALALEAERFRDHRHGKNAELLGDLGDDRRSAGTGAAAHARGKEEHVSAGYRLRDALAVLQRGLATDFRVRACAESLGDGGSKLQLQLRVRALERLHIGIGRDELNTLHALHDHVVDSIAAATTHPNDLDYRFLRLRIHDFKH